MTYEEMFDADLEQYLNKKKEAMIEDILWDFTDKITPRLKARMMKTPLMDLKPKLENLKKHYLNEYAKEA
jgi:hypothetical protein